MTSGASQRGFMAARLELRVESLMNLLRMGRADWDAGGRVREGGECVRSAVLLAQAVGSGAKRRHRAIGRVPWPQA